jgi:subtilase family protein
MPRSTLILLFLAIFLVQSAFAGQLDPELERRLATGGPDVMVNGLVVLSEQVDLEAVVEQVTAERGSLERRHYEVITRLRDMAASTQGPVLDAIDSYKDQGQVSRVRSFWIANAIAITGKAAVFNALAGRDDVRIILYDVPIELIAPATEGLPEAIAGSKGVENGILDTGAPTLWAMGFDGTGALACDQDTGADGSHPAFADRWRGLDAGVTPAEAWFDPVGSETFPTDAWDHGTHTLGTILGDAGDGNQIGMAPGAKWIGAKTIDVPGGDIFTDAVAAFEWAADPDGDPLTMDDVPDVVNNSWGLAQSWYGECLTDFNLGIDAAEAAGVIVVFAAGNEGSGSESLRSPGNRIESEFNAFAVGAVEQDGVTIAGFSSRGPSDCDHATIKPEVSAVGVDVRSALPGGDYGLKSGTSMATPTVAGAVLLLRGAFPQATPYEIKYALYITAVDLGTVGEDNDFGRGKINVVDAYWNLYDHFVNSDGRLETGELYNCRDTVTIAVADADLTAPTMTVKISSDTESAPETVTLLDAGRPGFYEGTFGTTPGRQLPDGKLEVADGDTITVTYSDADDGLGGTNVLKTATALVDCRAPQFAGLSSIDSGDNWVELDWSPASDLHDIVYNVYRAEASGTQDFGAPFAVATGAPHLDETVINNDRYFYVVRAQDAAGNEDLNRVELTAMPIGPVLIWEETWGQAKGWDHDWSIVNNGGNGTWSDQNPGGQDTVMTDPPFMIADSDYYRNEAMDEELISEAVDVTGYYDISIRFVNRFREYEWSNSEKGDVDVKLDGGSWTNIARYESTTAEVSELSLAGQSFETVEIRFHYYNAYYEWYWIIDNVQVWGWPDEVPDDDDDDDNDTVDDDDDDNDDTTDDDDDNDTIDDDDDTGAQGASASTDEDSGDADRCSCF